MTPEQMNDLIQRIAAKDKAAFSALYKEMEKPLYRFINLKLNDPFQSGDVMHEVFMEIWRNAGRFEGRSAARTWMFGIAYRKVMDVFRKSARIDLTDEIPDEADDAPDGEACLMASQDSAHVRHCLEELSPQHRSAVELAFFEDMTYREISEVAGVPENTVKTRIFHAKRLLMRCLEMRLNAGMVR